MKSISKVLSVKKYVLISCALHISIKLIEYAVILFTTLQIGQFGKLILIFLLVVVPIAMIFVKDKKRVFTAFEKHVITTAYILLSHYIELMFLLVNLRVAQVSFSDFWLGLMKNTPSLYIFLPVIFTMTVLTYAGIYITLGVIARNEMTKQSIRTAQMEK